MTMCWLEQSLECAVGGGRRLIADGADAVRDAVRAASLPLPVTVVATSLCTLVIRVSGAGSP
jgi:hypothetical protein